MIFSMVASLNITTVSAATQNMCDFKYFTEETTVGTSIVEKGMFTTYDGTTYSGKYFQISSSDKTKDVTYFPNGVDNVTKEPVLNIISDKYIWNNKAQIDLANNPVVNISFQYYIPKGTEKDARFLTLQLGKKSTTATSDLYNNSNYGIYNFYFNSSNNYVAGTCPTSSKSKVVTKYNYSIVPTDQWHDANLKIIAETDPKGNKSIKVCMYVDGRKHIICETTNEVAFDDVGIQQLYFNTTNATNGVPQHTEDTYIKNIKVDYEDTDPTIYSTVLFDTELNATKFSTNKTTQALEAKAVGTSTEKLQTSSNSDSHFETDGKTLYQNVKYDGENGALKVTLTPNAENSAIHALIQNFKGKITNYFPAGTNYMQMSYDIKIPADSVSATREQYWRIGRNETKLTTSLYTIGSRIKGGILNFYNDAISYNGDDTTRKSVDFAITPDKWYRIITLLKVTNSGTDYVLHTEGYVKDLATDKIYKIYEEDEAFPKLNGTTDGLVIAQQRTDIVTEAGDTDVVTYYDNILSRIWEDNFSDKYINRVTDMLPSDEESKFDIELNCHDGANAVAKARDVAGIGAKKLILAAYDGNKLVDIIVSTGENITDPDKGIVELNMNIDGKNVNKLKAFFFDDITKCKPLATAPELVVK